jgi:hypothetical protein
VQTYTYRGDRWTSAEIRGAIVTAVRRDDGRCVRGRNGNMLVLTADGRRVVVLGRQLRKLPPLDTGLGF